MDIKIARAHGEGPLGMEETGRILIASAACCIDSILVKSQETFLYPLSPAGGSCAKQSLGLSIAGISAGCLQQRGLKCVYSSLLWQNQSDHKTQHKNHPKPLMEGAQIGGLLISSPRRVEISAGGLRTNLNIGNISLNSLLDPHQG